MSSRISAVVAAFLGVFSIFTGRGGAWMGLLIIVCGGLYLAIPLLCRFGEVIAPLTFIVVAYVLITVLTLRAGTATGLQLYYLVGASIMVVVLGIEHIVLASMMAALGAGLAIAMRLLVPGDRCPTGLGGYLRIRRIGDLRLGTGGRDDLVCAARTRPRREGN